MAATALQAFLRTSATNGREVVRAGPFTATFDRADPLRYLNYAIPDDDAVPDGEAVSALRAAFRGHDRLPRLEWIEEAAPAVAPVLDASGMVQELRTPLMACAESDLVEPDEAIDGLRVGAVGDGDLRDTATVQWAAFGRRRAAAGAARCSRAWMACPRPPPRGRRSSPA